MITPFLAGCAIALLAGIVLAVKDFTLDFLENRP